jgi:HPt (histidine-containing phosphotransfer) domain-containing protein
VTQTPAHELLGSLANLSAEALAAARASLSAKVEERKHSFGESWEQTLRLAAHINGDADAARDFQSQVRWKDTEIRSLAQAADALGKLATMLGVPVELLWEKIPSWTQQDVERAKALAAQGGGLEALMRELAAGQADASAA